MMHSIQKRFIGVLIAGLVSATVAESSHAKSEAAVPDFTGLWGRMTFGIEPPTKGHGPLLNSARRPNGQSDGSKLIGDYHDPMLKAWAAAEVKRNGDLAAAGIAFPDPWNQCRPQNPPYIMRNQEIQLVQGKNEVAIIYMLDHQIRHIYLTAAHPKHVTPTWLGDSVGHYEGDTLVVDTIGIKVGPLTMQDQYGTPQTEALHMVERYRMVDEATAVAAFNQNEKEYGRTLGAISNGVVVDFDHKGPGLQVEFTVDDEGSLNEPWSSKVTYRKALSEWVEMICAENWREFEESKENWVPKAAKADF